jgi:hypothetical protein
MIRVTLALANHFILQKNHLTSEKATNITTLAKKLAGLPAEPATTPFLLARARLADFSSNELNQQRGLIKGLLMRNIYHIVPAENFATWHAATTRQRNQAFNAEFRLWGLETNDEIERLAGTILAGEAGQPATAEAIVANLPQDRVKILTQTSRGGRVSQTTNVDLALRWLVGRGEMGLVNLSPDWRAEMAAYAPLQKLYPNIDLTAAPGEAEAQKLLARAYLSAFGPATEADISFWTGFGKSETARAVAALRSETTLTMVEGIPGMLLTLKSQADALPAVELPATPIINILPADDPYPTAYRASRSRYFVDPSHQRHVFTNAGAARPAIVVNGQIVGMWDWTVENEQHRLTWQMFAQVDPAILPLIQTELAQVGAFIHPHITLHQKTD